MPRLTCQGNSNESGLREPGLALDKIGIDFSTVIFGISWHHPNKDWENYVSLITFSGGSFKCLMERRPMHGLNI